jgi:uncharacterized damage-inducible protein DinB
MSCPMCNKKHAYTIDQAIASLAASGRRMERLAAVLSPKRAAARPASDKWSAKEIICHLADCELVYGMRYRKILSEPEATLVAFDQEAWEKNLHYGKQSLKAALATFQVLRAGHVTLLRGLPKSAWNKTGMHPSYGALSLRQIVVHIADHDKNHLAQITRLTE